MSLEVIVLKLQNEVHAHNESEMVESHAFEIKNLKERLLAIKEITLQIQDT